LILHHILTEFNLKLKYKQLLVFNVSYYLYVVRVKRCDKLLIILKVKIIKN